MSECVFVRIGLTLERRAQRAFPVASMRERVAQQSVRLRRISQAHESRFREGCGLAGPLV